MKLIIQTEDEISMDEHFYQSVIQNITDNLKGITLDENTSIPTGCA